jgi:hypothetical protein
MDWCRRYQAGEKETPDLAMPAQFSGAMMDRYRDLGRSLFKVLGIGREDNHKRSAHYANNYNAFGAPVLVYVTVPAGQTAYAAYDAGAFVANFCLAAADAGLGTCIIAALARYPQVVREHLPISDDESLVIGLSLGWPEAGAEVNAFRSARDPLGKGAGHERRGVKRNAGGVAGKRRELMCGRFPSPSPARMRRCCGCSWRACATRTWSFWPATTASAGIPGHEFVGVVDQAPTRPDLVGHRVVAEINFRLRRLLPLPKRRRPAIVPNAGPWASRARPEPWLNTSLVPVISLLAVDEEISDRQAVFAEPLGRRLGARPADAAHGRDQAPGSWAMASWGFCAPWA